MSYIPKTGLYAGKMNRAKIENYLEENPDCTGVEIQKALGLSRATVCKHLKNIRIESESKMQIA